MGFEHSGYMASVEALWWLGFLGTFGACVGSFLNVVIYRLPRDLSLSEPMWSFCPGCTTRIRWYDNLPVLGYLRLGGKCRDCGMAISPRYPTVELLGAIIVLLLFDGFFIAHTHAGLGSTIPGITWQLSEDWPILLAHAVLFTSLLAMSAIDIEHYWVDVRFTTLAAGAGFLFHAMWTPGKRVVEWHRPSESLAIGALAATIVWILTMLVMRFVYRNETGAQAAVEPGAPKSFYDELASRRLAGVGAIPAVTEVVAAPSKIRPLLGYVAGFATLGVMAIVAFGACTDYVELGPQLSPALRWTPALVLLFVFIVAGAAPHRDADREIMEAIEAERPEARRVAITELLWLLPAVVVGVLAVYFDITNAAVGDSFGRILGWEPRYNWAPIQGLGTAAAGFVIGGGIGWLVRIVATIIMGREAFGTGDIHMMAAAGCVAGWPVVLIGFMLCSFLALAGWLLTLPFKQSRAIPLGPWLSIAFLIVVLFYDRIIATTVVQNVIYLFSAPVSFGNITGPW